MKNQNDLIVAIAAAVVSIGAGCAFFFTKPEPTAPAAPTKVNLTPAALPAGDVVFSNALPGGGGGGAGRGPSVPGGRMIGAGGPAIGGGPGGPPPGIGGPPRGMGMPGGPAPSGGGGLTPSGFSGSSGAGG